MRCAYCRSRVFQSGAGRPKRWCSDRCRNRGRSRLRSLRRQLAQAEVAGLTMKAELLRLRIEALEVPGGESAEAREQAVAPHDVERA